MNLKNTKEILDWVTIDDSDNEVLKLVGHSPNPQ